ncbi:hypothetical protein TNIN_349101 [Trichonephila inaurata madagascariensis]|uniref:Uncharacterized protein n=1 Tax=Trichonephila inaurata madagascariensis TaxID=2747483 RepID=A0A8X7CDM1_9ARAC|nr:hypothetical protein TNIN_349101 [Trichonephila inaurata madagascariensis]
MHLSRTLEVDTQASDTTKPIHQKTLLQKSARKKKKRKKIPKRFIVSLGTPSRARSIISRSGALNSGIFSLLLLFRCGLEEKSGLRSIVCVRYPLVLRRLLCA